MSVSDRRTGQDRTGSPFFTLWHGIVFSLCSAVFSRLLLSFRSLFFLVLSPNCNGWPDRRSFRGLIDDIDVLVFLMMAMMLGTFR